MTIKLDVCQLLDYFEAKYEDVVGMFCLNISSILPRSLNKNNEELCQFVSIIHHEFDVIVLSEIVVGMF